MTTDEKIFNALIAECNKVMALRPELIDNTKGVTFPAKLSDLASKCKVTWDGIESAEPIEIVADNYKGTIQADDLFIFANNFRKAVHLKDVTFDIPKEKPTGEIVCSFDMNITKEMQVLLKFLSKNDVRPVLNGVYIDIENSNAVATEGHILRFYHVDITNIQGTPSDASVIIDPKNFKMLFGTCHVDVYGYSDYIIYCNGMQITGRIDGRYPNYLGVLPKVNMCGRIEIADPKEFIKIAKGFAKYDFVYLTYCEGYDYLLLSTGKNVGTENMKFINIPIRNKPKANFNACYKGEHLYIALQQFTGVLWYVSHYNALTIDTNSVTNIILPYTSGEGTYMYDNIELVGEIANLQRNKETAPEPKDTAAVVSLPAVIEHVTADEIEDTAAKESTPEPKDTAAVVSLPAVIEHVTADEINDTAAKETESEQENTAAVAVIPTIRKKNYLARALKIAAAVIAFVGFSALSYNIETTPAQAVTTGTRTIAAPEHTAAPETVKTSTTDTTAARTIAAPGHTVAPKTDAITNTDDTTAARTIAAPGHTVAPKTDAITNTDDTTAADTIAASGHTTTPETDSITNTDDTTAAGVIAPTAPASDHAATGTTSSGTTTNTSNTAGGGTNAPSTTGAPTGTPTTATASAPAPIAPVAI